MPDRLVVEFKQSATLGDVGRAVGQHGGSVIEAHAPSRLAEIEVPAQDALTALAGYRADPAVASASYSHVARITYTPNDTNYSHQWNMHDTVVGRARRRRGTSRRTAGRGWWSR